MPRWKALPDELDPQVREFAGQLRRLVDRSGLSIAAVADRTGYSKTSWERYLNGRLLAPKGAIVALAEVTGTNPVHLTTMWELAERAWSRAEMRHDMTMEAHPDRPGACGARRVRAEPGGPWREPPLRRSGHRHGRRHSRGRGYGPGRETGMRVGATGARAPSVPIQRGTSPRVPQQSQARPGAGSTDAYGSAAGGGRPQPQHGGGRAEAGRPPQADRVPRRRGGRADGDRRRGTPDRPGR